MKKIAFFDIDGTLTSEIDGSIPESAVYAIRAARANGNLMFINTGRCFQNVEQRFRDVGFDGFVCGCGTDIYCDGAEILHVAQTHETVMKLLLAAREWDIDILFESRKDKNCTIDCWTFCRSDCHFHTYIVRRFERQITG